MRAFASVAILAKQAYHSCVYVYLLLALPMDVLSACFTNPTFVEMLGYTLPTLRVNRELRSFIDVRHLHNVLWGKECGVCDRHVPRTFVFVCENDRGGQIIYTCFLCSHGQYPGQ
jgi:hypothetical protein